MDPIVPGQANIKSAEATGGKIGGGEHVFQYLADLEGVDLKTLATNKLAEFKERATNMYQVLLCFDGINRFKYGAVKNSILKNSLLGDDDKKVSLLPKSYTELLHAMNGFKPEGSNRSRHYQGGRRLQLVRGE